MPCGENRGVQRRTRKREKVLERPWEICPFIIHPWFNWQRANEAIITTVSVDRIGPPVVPVPRISGMGIYKTKRCRVLVMYTWYEALGGLNCIEKQATSHQGQNRRCLQGSTYPSSEKSPQRRKNKFCRTTAFDEGKAGCHAESFSDGVEQPDLQK